jgi:dynein heavy chain
VEVKLYISSLLIFDRLRADGIKFSEPFSFSAFMGNPIIVRKWHAMGLPSGNTSVENALLCLEGKTWPLIIDPQSQALDWITNMDKEHKLAVSSFNQPDFIRTLESSIHFGTPLVLENMEQDIDPIIDPVLLHEEYRLEGRLTIKIRDKFIPYNENFKLYMLTKHANPYLSQELATKVNVINFSITPTALQEQILHTGMNLGSQFSNMFSG